MNHMSGPWVMGNQPRQILGGETHEAVIAEVWVQEDGSEAANAHLIAAAPELLVACKAAEKFIDAIMSFYGLGLEVTNWHFNGDTEPLDNFIDENSEDNELELLRRAIEKAEIKS